MPIAVMHAIFKKITAVLILILQY